MADIQAARGRHLPGDIAVWFFIFAELAVFGILFIGYGVARSMDPATFSAVRIARSPSSFCPSALLSAPRTQRKRDPKFGMPRPAKNRRITYKNPRVLTKILDCRQKS